MTHEFGPALTRQDQLAALSRASDAAGAPRSSRRRRRRVHLDDRTALALGGAVLVLLFAAGAWQQARSSSCLPVKSVEARPGSAASGTDAAPSVWRSTTGDCAGPGQQRDQAGTR